MGVLFNEADALDAFRREVGEGAEEVGEDRDMMIEDAGRGAEMDAMAAESRSSRRIFRNDGSGQMAVCSFQECYFQMNDTDLRRVYCEK